MVPAIVTVSAPECPSPRPNVSGSARAAGPARHARRAAATRRSNRGRRIRRSYRFGDFAPTPPAPLPRPGKGGDFAPMGLCDGRGAVALLVLLAAAARARLVA